MTPALGAVAADHDLFADTDAFRTGTILMTVADVAETGWLFCDGQTVLRSSPLGVWAAGRFGAGNGSTTYNVPNLDNRFPLGKRSTENIGGTGGAADHSHAAGSIAIAAHTHAAGTLALPSHSHPHNLYIPDHTHNYITNTWPGFHASNSNCGFFAPGASGGVPGDGGGPNPPVDGTVGANSAAVSGTSASATPSSSGTLATAEVPWQAIRFIIKT